MTAENEKIENEGLKEEDRFAAAFSDQAHQPAWAPEDSTVILNSHKSFSHFKPGEIISGRYRIVSEIGQGGMGTVYKAEQVFLHCAYAIKLFDACQSSPSSLMRFQREAQAAHDLDHPNLVRVHDFGTLEDSTPFLVMDLVEGETLSSIIKTQGRLPEKKALKIFLQLCDGLIHAHERGIVHRDLKPSNIMVRKYEKPDAVYEVKILDFGIAKILHENELDSLPLTRTGEVFGSPLYMSPEQCYGRKVDQRSDIYSLGCSLYEALTGLPPFSGDGALSTMLKHQIEAPLSLKEVLLGEHFPQSLESVIERLLAKDPESRYQSACAVKEDLLRVLENREITAFSPVSKKAQVNKIPAKVTLLVAVAASFLLAVAVFILSPAKHAPSESVTSTVNPPVRHDGQILAEIRTSMPSAIDRYFALNSIKESARGPWLLNFPKKSIGCIWTQARGYNKRIEAEGNISIPSAQPLSFEPNKFACMETTVFHAFRPDEIDELRFSHNAQAGDDVLRNISHLSGLKRLN